MSKTKSPVAASPTLFAGIDVGAEELVPVLRRNAVSTKARTEYLPKRP